MARRKGRSLTQADVIQAALSSLHEAGEEGLGVKHVAQKLGIKPPSLYNHVTGHQDIRRLVAIEGWRSLYSQIHPHEHNPSPLHIASRIRDFAKQHAPLFAVMGTTPLSSDDPDYHPLHTAHQHFFSRWFQHHHNYTPEDSEHAATLLRSFVHGFCLMQHFGHHSAHDTAFDHALTKLFPAPLSSTHPTPPHPASFGDHTAPSPPPLRPSHRRSSPLKDRCSRKSDPFG